MASENACLEWVTFTATHALNLENDMQNWLPDQIHTSSGVSSAQYKLVLQRESWWDQSSYLQQLIDQRLSKPRPVSTQTTDRPSSLASSRRSHDGPSSYFTLDLGSLVGGRDSGKSPKYPEKTLKAMDGILQRIAMGQEVKWDQTNSCIRSSSS